VEILRRNLDEEQRRIAEIVDENLLVLAGPGSGKTRLLTNAAAYHLRLAPSEPWRVCCLTFTVEAARELRARLKSPDLGVVPTQRIWAGNFHQFAQMLLGSYGHLLGWPRTAGIITPTEINALLPEIVRDLGMGNVNIADVRIAIAATKGRRPLPESVDHRSESFVRISQAYQDRLREAALRDFDDLLVDAIRLLSEHSGIRRLVSDTFRHIFVDELQDTSQIQMDLLEQLVDPATVRIFGVADADQMIYTWRDARPENLEEFE
jgi:DNA helicase II / ATP-dependent DNA helicase PcrA